MKFSLTEKQIKKFGAHVANLKIIDNKVVSVCPKGEQSLDSVRSKLNREGFYFIVDYRRRAIHVSYVSDENLTNGTRKGFNHTTHNINIARSKPMEELRGMLENRRNLKVYHSYAYCLVDFISESLHYSQECYEEFGELYSSVFSYNVYFQNYRAINLALRKHFKFVI